MSMFVEHIPLCFPESVEILKSVEISKKGIAGQGFAAASQSEDPTGSKSWRDTME